MRVEESIIDDVIDAVRRYPALSREFDEIASGKTVPATDFIASLKMPHHLTTAWLEEAIEEGRIAKVKKGRWLVVSAAIRL